jgi:Ca-activated chloride channel homolog
LRLLSPWALTALTALAALGLAHLRRPPRREVASVLLWRHLEAAALPRSRRIARPALPLLLLFQAAAVAFGAAALAEPVVPPSHAAGAAAPPVVALRDAGHAITAGTLAREAAGCGAPPGCGPLPGSGRADVTIAGNGPAMDALARAFRAMPGVTARVLDSTRYREATDLRRARLLVLDHWLPPGGIPATAPAVLLVDPPALPDGGRAGGPLADPVLSGLDDTSPLLAGVDLTSWSVPAPATERVTGPAWLAPVAWTPSGPLLAAGIAEPGQRRIAVLAVDPARTNLPQLAAFPIMLQDIVRWAAGPAPGSARGGQARPAGPAASARPAVATGAPWWRGCAAAALAALAAEAAYLARLGWRSGIRRPRGRKAILARLAAIALLGVALAGPVLTRPGGGAPLVLADRSGSVAGRALDAESAWLKDIRQAAPRTQVVSFGAVTETDIGAAIPAGLDVPGAASASRIVLLSDGRATSGDVLAAAEAARVPVDVADVGRGAADPDAAVTRLATPDAVRAGDPVTLQVTVRATVAQRATVTAWRDGRAVTRLAVRLAAGDNPLLISMPSGAPGGRRFRVTVTMAGDQVAGDDTLDAVTRVAGAPHLLYAGPDGPLPALLRHLGFLVSALPPSALPGQARGYLGVDAVLLPDVPSGSMAPAQVTALVTAVRAKGLGLLVLGGPHSLDATWYEGTPLPAALPVTGTGSGPAGAPLELVLDRSGSMNDLGGNIPKIAMARAAALGAIAFARARHDQLGIVSFDTVPRVLVPVQAMTGAAAAIADRAVTGLSASGGTDIYAALRTAAGQLARLPGPKQMILMTDGVSQSSSYDALVRQMASAGVSLATVGLGGQVDQALLRKLAALGGGRYYYTSDAAALPRIFATEERRGVRPDYVTGQIPSEVTASVPAVRGLIGSRLPAIGGLDATALKPLATADITSTAVTPRGAGRHQYPVLAQWQYGLGRVAAWTPGAAAAWARGWLATASVWGDTIRWLLPGVPVPVLAPRLADAHPGGAPTVLVDTAGNAGTPVTAAALRATVTTPRGHPASVTLNAAGPGLFAAALPDGGPGVYQVSVRPPGRSGLPAVTTDLAVAYPREYLPGPAGPALLAQLAEATGGRVLTDPASAARWESAHNGTHQLSLWWLLIALALAAFGAGVLVHPPPPRSTYRRGRYLPEGRLPEGEGVQAPADRAQVVDRGDGGAAGDDGQVFPAADRVDDRGRAEAGAKVALPANGAGARVEAIQQAVHRSREHEAAGDGRAAQHRGGHGPLPADHAGGDVDGGERAGRRVLRGLHVAAQVGRAGRMRGHRRGIVAGVVAAVVDAGDERQPGARVVADG